MAVILVGMPILLDLCLPEESEATTPAIKTGIIASTNDTLRVDRNKATTLIVHKVRIRSHVCVVQS